MNSPGKTFRFLTAVALAMLICTTVSAQDGKPRREKKSEQSVPAAPDLKKGFTVSGGRMVKPFVPDSALFAAAGDSTVLLKAADSLSQIYPADYGRVDSLLRKRFAATADTTARDSLPVSNIPQAADSAQTSFTGAVPQDSAMLAARVLPDTAGMGMMPDTTMSRRELRRLERYRARLDTMNYRHSPFFRDSIPISRLTWISALAPGFAQFYNGDYWKIPVLYATAGTALGFGISQNSKYKTYKRQYDDLIAHNATRDELDPVQTKMIRHNTARQLLFLGAAASYLYFLGDGVLNYPGPMTQVKKATTLSMICPGAGQIYNRSYWKVPIVVGGFATFVYMIDWNNRGYKRFDLAYKLLTDNDPNTVDKFNGQLEAKYLLNLRKNYRRNRDLCIILTVAWYFLNVMDAHVDAHLKDYDISDDLTFNIQPSIDRLYTTSRGSANTVGLNFCIWF